MLINVYVANPAPDPRGGGQLPNPNECNSTLTSGTNNIYPYPYTKMLMIGVTAYELPTRRGGQQEDFHSNGIEVDPI